MAVLSKIVGLLTGGLGAKIIGAVKDYFPPSMTDKDKQAFEMKLMEVSHSHEIELLKELQVAEAEFNQRIKDLEGTASDLKEIPIVGAIIIFMRGFQRPAFGFFTIMMDYLVFSGSWVITEGSRVETAFFTINLLVLGFLFGERAVKNIMPLFDRYMGKGK